MFQHELDNLFHVGCSKDSIELALAGFIEDTTASHFVFEDIIRIDNVRNRQVVILLPCLVGWRVHHDDHGWLAIPASFDVRACVRQLLRTFFFRRGSRALLGSLLGMGVFELMDNVAVGHGSAAGSWVTMNG